MPAPVGHTCPNIDKTIKKLKTIRELVDDTFHDIKAQLDKLVYKVESELDDIEDDLEELRSDNSSLREWGTESEDRIDELEDELNELRSMVD